MSTFMTDAPFIRPTIDPGPQNGLAVVSQVMADKVTPVRKSAIGSAVGHLSDEDMARVESALVNITGLRRSVLPIQTNKPEDSIE